jgi:hypothetical protein
MRTGIRRFVVLHAVLMNDAAQVDAGIRYCSRPFPLELLSFDVPDFR